MPASIFNGSAVKILKNILRFKDGTELSSTTAGHLTGVTSDVQTQLNSKIPNSEKGAALGVATLDASSKIPVSQLPNSVMEYLGTWDASTNSPALADGVGNAGDLYRVSVAGTQNLGSGNISFNVGDYVIYNGTIWEKSPNTTELPQVEYRTITVGEAAAKQLTLAATPSVAAKTFVEAVEGSAQVYGTDYTVAGAVLDWSGLGLDTIGLAAGDRLRIWYWV